MSSPKKKLSTKPIRIDLPQTTKANSIELDSLGADSGNLANGKPDSSQLENNSSSSFPDFKKQDSVIQDSEKLESINQAVAPLESTQAFSTDVQSSKLDSQVLELQNLESSLEEYKKVAMRLSAVASERLKQLRITTGIPYEILVDVMIRNWDSLPVRTQTAFIKEAQQIRASRLLAGQQKTMDTMQRKYASR